MNLADANLLLYAYDASSPRHLPARAWLEENLNGLEPFAIPWSSVHAFLRIGTHPSVFANPMSIQEALGTVESWLALPSVHVPEPGPRYWQILRDLVLAGQARGNLVGDAHLAALAIENGATLCTTDRDFARFPGVRIVDPTAP